MTDPPPTGCEACDLHPAHPADDDSIATDFLELHRQLHITGALIMLELLPAARAVLSLVTHGRVPVDKVKVDRWRRIADQQTRQDTT